MDKYTEDLINEDDKIYREMMTTKSNVLFHFDFGRLIDVKEEIALALIFAAHNECRHAQKVVEHLMLDDLDIIAVLEDFAAFKNEFLAMHEHKKGEEQYESI